MPFCSCSAFSPRPSLFVILSEAKNLKRGSRARGEVVSLVEQAGEGVLVLDFVLERLAHDVHGDGVVHVHLLEQVVIELDGVALALDAVLEHTLPVGAALGWERLLAEGELFALAPLLEGPPAELHDAEKLAFGKY